MFGAAELDFYIRAGPIYLVQLDGDWIHKSAGQREQDRVQDDRIWQELRHQNPQPISRIRGSLIQDFEHTRRVVNQLFMGRVFRPEVA